MIVVRVTVPVEWAIELGGHIGLMHAVDDLLDDAMQDHYSGTYDVRPVVFGGHGMCRVNVKGEGMPQAKVTKVFRALSGECSTGLLSKRSVMERVAEDAK